VFDREPVSLRWCMSEGTKRNVRLWGRILSVIGHPLPCNYAFQMQNYKEPCEYWAYSTSVLLSKVTLHYDIGMSGAMNNGVAVLHNDLSGNHCALR
jgi:hypothetical protein